MATFDTNTVEGKIAAGLDPLRGDQPQSAVESLARNIAFIMRYKLRPDIAAHEVSVLVLKPLSSRNEYMNRMNRPAVSCLIFIVILVHLGSEDVKKFVTVKAQGAQNAFTELTAIVDGKIHMILADNLLMSHQSDSILDEIR